MKLLLISTWWMHHVLPPHSPNPLWDLYGASRYFSNKDFSELGFSFVTWVAACFFSSSCLFFFFFLIIWTDSNWYCWFPGAKSCWFSAQIFLTLVLAHEKAEACPLMGLVASGVQWHTLVPVTGLNGNTTQHWLASAYSRRSGLQLGDQRLNTITNTNHAWVCFCHYFMNCWPAFKMWEWWIKSSLAKLSFPPTWWMLKTMQKIGKSNKNVQFEHSSSDSEA